MPRRARPSLLGLVLTVVGVGVVALLLARVLRARRPTGALGAPVITDRPTAPPRAVVDRLPVVEPTIVEVGDVDQPGEPEVDTAAAAAAAAAGAAGVAAPPPPAKKAVAKKKAGVKKAVAKKAAPAKKAVAKKSVARRAPHRPPES